MKKAEDFLIENGMTTTGEVIIDYGEGRQLKLTEVLNTYLAVNKKEVCEWLYYDSGFYGCPNYEYTTKCGKTYETKPGIFCPGCGGLIKSKN